VPLTPLPVDREFEITGAERRLVFDAAGDLVLDALARVDADAMDCPALIKRSGTDGTTLWKRPYRGRQQPEGDYADCPERWREIALDGNDDIVAIGSIELIADGQPGPQTMMVRRFDRDGYLVWTWYHQDGEEPPHDRADDVATDPGGGVFAGGQLGDAPHVASLAADGSVRWIWSDPSAPPLTRVAVEGDPFGNAIVATDGGTDAPDQLLAIDPAGEARLLAEIPGGIASHGVRGPVGALAVDLDGAALIVGRDPPRLSKVGPDGTHLWDVDLANDFAVDETGCEVSAFPYSVALTTAPDRSVFLAFYAVIDIEHQPDGDEIPPLNPNFIGLAHISSEGQLVSVQYDEGPQGHADDVAVAADGTVAILIDFPPRIALIPPP